MPSQTLSQNSWACSQQWTCVQPSEVCSRDRRFQLVSCHLHRAMALPWYAGTQIPAWEALAEELYVYHTNEDRAADRIIPTGNSSWGPACAGGAGCSGMIRQTMPAPRAVQGSATTLTARTHRLRGGPPLVRNQRAVTATPAPRGGRRRRRVLRGRSAPPPRGTSARPARRLQGARFHPCVLSASVPCKLQIAGTDARDLAL